MALARRFSSAFLLCLLSAAAVNSRQEKKEKNDNGDECVYSVYVKTGSIIKGGTDAKISLTLGDTHGRRISVPDIESSWGLMEPGHDYFERGNVDIFSGRAACLSSPLCHLNLTSDGSGSHHGWYCDYLEITSTGPHIPCAQTLFYVRQWLADDVAGAGLTAIVDGCGQGQISAGHAALLVVGTGDDAAASSSI